jgi:hypothetical protein
MSSVISAIKAGNIEMTCSELDKDYFRNAKERILTFQSQLDMFTTPADIIFHEKPLHPPYKNQAPYGVIFYAGTGIKVKQQFPYFTLYPLRYN